MRTVSRHFGTGGCWVLVPIYVVIDDRRIFLKTVLGEVITQCDQFFFVLHERNGQFE